MGAGCEYLDAYLLLLARRERTFRRTKESRKIAGGSIPLDIVGIILR